MKRALMLIAIATMSVSALCESLPDGGPYKETVDGIEWTFMVANGEAAVGTGSSLTNAASMSVNGAVSIPQNLGGRAVTSIASYAFDSRSLITSVAIHSSVRTIGLYAFQFCTGLETVLLSEGLIEIKAGAFADCDKLSKINIPLSVERIDYAFTKKSSLGTGLIYVDGCLIANCGYDGEELVVPEGTRIIAGGIGYNKSFKRVVFPKSLKYIGSQAFWGAKNIQEIELPEGMTGVGTGAFQGCVGLNMLSLGEGPTELPYSSFYGCSNLVSVFLPASVTNIAQGAFGTEYGGRCPRIDTLHVGTCIDIRNSFPEAYKTVRHLVLHKNSDRIGGFPLIQQCEGVIDVQLPTGITDIANSAFYGYKSLMELSIPEGVTNIGEFAFLGCSCLHRISIPDSVTRIGSYAFERCTNLNFITLPANVTMLESGTFSWCTSLSTIALPNGLRYVGDNAFDKCAALHQLSIPPCVRECSSSAFEGCENIEQIDFEGGPPAYRSFASIPSSVIKRYNSCYASDWEWTISRYHLANFVSYTPLKADGGPYRELVANIEWCFVVSARKAVIMHHKNYVTQCSGNVIIPELLGNRRVVGIDSDAFNGCANMTSVFIPQCVTNIGVDAFAGCGGLTKVVIPQAVAQMSDIFPSAYQNITNVVVLDGVTHIVDDAFKDCVGLTSVSIPSSVTSIGSGAFSGCANLTSVDLGGDAPDLAADAFYGTPKRLVISVPENSIGWNGDLTTTLPDTWGGRAIVHSGQSYDWDSGTATMQNFYLTITNVVVQYVLRSAQPEIAVPLSGDTGFVNVITEVVSEGAVAVPGVWKGNYAGFEAKFGDDFVKALMKPTGKVDGAGNAMLVWQDYVAGTDPTNPDDKFMASVTMVDGEPVISWMPELPADQADLRKYTTYGKARLQDAEWTVVNGDAVKYNFFKVTVEMK